MLGHPLRQAQDEGRIARPDCVVANAGINVPPSPLGQFDPDSFRRLVEVNIVGAFNVLRYAAQHVADGGSIIVITTSLVRVNAVAPGPVDTDLFRAGKDEEALKRSAALSPFNRVGQPREVAEVVSFLVSEKASWVHGQIVQPNGGLV